MINQISIEKEFWHKGYYSPIKAFDKGKADYYRNAFLTHEKTLAENITNDSFAMLHLFFPWAYQLVTEPSILEIVKPILGPDILVHGSNIFYKKPNDQKFVSWHQDSFYSKLNSPKYVTAWVAFVDSTIQNGCLRVIPETHYKVLPHTEHPQNNNLLLKGTTVDISSMEDKVIDIELKAGEMSLHHANLIHGSNPNISGKRRIGFAIRYVSTELTQEAYHHKVVLASGEYNNPHFDLLTEPPTGTLEQCIIAQQKGQLEFERNRGR